MDPDGCCLAGSEAPGEALGRSVLKSCCTLGGLGEVAGYRAVSAISRGTTLPCLDFISTYLILPVKVRQDRQATAVSEGERVARRQFTG